MQIFRECDIRGLYPEEVNEELLFALGNAIGAYWKRLGPFVVAHDVRRGSRDLKTALAAGMIQAGAHILDLGCVPTPVAYFARRIHSAPVAAIVTASHNPPEYNGLKLLTPNGPAGQKEIAWLQQQIGRTRKQEPGGTSTCLDIWPDYINFLEKFWDQWHTGQRERVKAPLAIDPGGGAWSGVAGRMMRRLGIPCVAINDVPDEMFRARSSDCAAPGSLNRLSCAVQKHAAAAGLAWDGDGDRLAVVDRSGRVLTADQIGVIFAQAQSLGNERVLLDVKVSSKVAAEIQTLGGTPVVAKSAHCVLERTMVEQDCAFGCEYSGHYFFRDLAGADDGLYSALRLISLLNHRSLDSLLEQVPKFFVTPDIRVQMTAKDFPQLQADLLKSGFSQKAVASRLDGLKLTFPEGWLLLRPSVSEDKLSFRAEGETAEDLFRLVHSFLEALPAGHESLQAALESWVVRSHADPW